MQISEKQVQFFFFQKSKTTKGGRSGKDLKKKTNTRKFFVINFHIDMYVRYK